MSLLIVKTLQFSTHYSVGKYSTKLLNPLTQNEYSLKDTFDGAERIKKISKELLRNEECTLTSLDIVSFFTNVPLRKTVNIVLDRVYNQKSSVKWGLLKRSRLGFFKFLTTLKLLKTTKITISEKTPFFKITKK